MLTSRVATLHDNSAHGEDSYFVHNLNDHAFLDAVMDGVTQRRGADASQAVAEVLAETLPTSGDDVVACLETANAQLHRMGWGRMVFTTASVTLCQNDHLDVISAGDSPVYLIRQDSVQRLMSRTSGFLTSGIARALGMRQPLGNLYRADLPLQAGDRLVLATDGVSDSVTQDELADIVLSVESPEAAATEVNHLIVERQEAGWLPEDLGGRFRPDDRTAIFRFFDA